MNRESRCELYHLYEVDFNHETEESYELDVGFAAELLRLLKSTGELTHCASELQGWCEPSNSELCWIEEYVDAFKNDVKEVVTTLDKTYEVIADHLIGLLSANLHRFIRGIPDNTEVFFGHSAWEDDRTINFGVIYLNDQGKQVLRTIEMPYTNNGLVKVIDHKCTAAGGALSSECISEYLEAYTGVHKDGHGGSLALTQEMLDWCTSYAKDDSNWPSMVNL